MYFYTLTDTYHTACITAIKVTCRTKQKIVEDLPINNAGNIVLEASNFNFAILLNLDDNIMTTMTQVIRHSHTRNSPNDESIIQYKQPPKHKASSLRINPGRCGNI